MTDLKETIDRFLWSNQPYADIRDPQGKVVAYLVTPEAVREWTGSKASQLPPTIEVREKTRKQRKDAAAARKAEEESRLALERSRRRHEDERRRVNKLPAIKRKSSLLWATSSSPLPNANVTIRRTK